MWLPLYNHGIAVESEVVFMDFILTLIYILGFSLAMNLALIAIIVVYFMNKE